MPVSVGWSNGIEAVGRALLRETTGRDDSSEENLAFEIDMLRHIDAVEWELGAIHESGEVVAGEMDWGGR